MSALLDLAERCERATGPDRELDRAIRDAVYHPCLNNGATYTASLDAAMRLLPQGEGRWPQLEYIGPNPNNPSDGHRVKIWSKGSKPVRGENPVSFALALCAAALRARAAQWDTRPQGGDATEIAAPFTSGPVPRSGMRPTFSSREKDQ
jgi:hypothetical protein